MTDGDQASDDTGQHYATQRFSLIPSQNGSVHAVLDDIVRAVFHNATWSQGLPAMCDAQVHPMSFLSVEARLCADCERKIQTFPGVLVPRPAPGNPLLNQMRDLYPQVVR